MTSSDHKIADAFGSILEPSRDMLIFLAINVLAPQWMVRHVPMKANRVVTENCYFLRTLCGSILQEKEQAMLSEKKDAAADETDIFSNIIKSGDFTDDEIIDQMLTMLAAGVRLPLPISKPLKLTSHSTKQQPAQ
jgi:cytochrome P450